jgi:hypothetical protein
MSDAETENLVRGFIRYLETLNKLKRTLRCHKFYDLAPLPILDPIYLIQEDLQASHRKSYKLNMGRTTSLTQEEL